MGFKLYQEGNSKLPEAVVKAEAVFIEYIYIIVPIIILAALWISYRISVNIFRKKEF